LLDFSELIRVLVTLALEIPIEGGGLLIGFKMGRKSLEWPL
jgi:hypothetical protein